MNNHVTSEPLASAGSLYELIDYDAVGSQSATTVTAGVVERFTGTYVFHLTPAGLDGDAEVCQGSFR